MNTSNLKPRSVAFFDVDDTLISVKSMLSFQDFWYAQAGDPEGQQVYRQDLEQHWRPGASWAFLNRLYYRHFAGRSEREVLDMGRQWFARTKAESASFYHPRPLSELRAHQREGRAVVFVSGSFPALLQPIAQELGVEHVLATRLEVAHGRYTGEILPPQTIGEGKVTAMRAFIKTHGLVADQCYAYGDDVSDFPMLELVGRPTVVTGGRDLEAKAQAQGWRMIAPA